MSFQLFPGGFVLFSFFADYMLNIIKSLLFSFITEHNKQSLQPVGCLLMHPAPAPALVKIFKRFVLIVIFSVIDLTCGYPVAEHLDQIFGWHRNRFFPVQFRIVINPILKMMLIPALMMKPCPRIPKSFSLFFVWTFIP